MEVLWSNVNVELSRANETDIGIRSKTPNRKINRTIASSFLLVFAVLLNREPGVSIEQLYFLFGLIS